MIFQYNGKEFEGTRNEIIYQLRQTEKLKQREIAELMGVTKSAISLILVAAGLGGSLKHPELENKELFQTMSDEELAERYNIPMYLIKKARRTLGLKTVKIHVGARRAELAEFLFGAGCKPGPSFFETVKIVAQETLTPRRAELIVTFLQGRIDQADYERVYRSEARRMLKQVIQEWDRDWEGEGVVTQSNFASY